MAPRHTHHPRRGVPWWTPLLALAVLAAVVGFAAARSGGEEASASGVLGAQHRTLAKRRAATTTTAARTTTAAAAPTGLRPGSYAAEHSVRVLDVVGPAIFWVGRDPAHSTLVHLQGPGTRWGIRPGQRLTFTAVVARNKAGSAGTWGLTRSEGRDRYERRGIHFEVYGLRIRFLCVRRCT